MKSILSFNKTYLSASLVAIALVFAQCSGSSDYKENEDEQREANASYNEDSAMFPKEKLQQSTNLTDGQPLEIETGEYQDLNKKILLATLNRHKTLIEDRIEQMKDTPQNDLDNSTVEGNLEQLIVYRKKLGDEIAKVRNVSTAQFGKVEATAQAAIKGAGAVMQSSRLQIDRGF